VASRSGYHEVDDAESTTRRKFYRRWFDRAESGVGGVSNTYVQICCMRNVLIARKGAWDGVLIHTY
jgi:hypothetical protein